MMMSASSYSNLQSYFYNLFLRSFKPLNFIYDPKRFLFLINVDWLSDVRNFDFLNLAIVLGGLHAVVTWGRTQWPIRGCAAGQSVVRGQNLDTLDTNEPSLKGN